MKYITEVVLENFQSHKYSKIYFQKGLNVIVGPSDSGKTAVIRAIKWALFNEPSGDYFIREGETECSVTISFNDNVKLKRYRSKSKNQYVLYDENNKKHVYEGFGTNVPYEIKEKIGIDKIYLDDKQSSLINISDQLEGPFLISEKNSIKANAIGRLVGVHILDNAISNTVKDIRNLSIEKKNILNTNENLNNQLKSYEYLDDLKAVTIKLNSIQNEVKFLYDKLNKLYKIKKVYDQNINKIKALEAFLEKLSELDKLEELYNCLGHALYRYNRLIYLKSNFDKINYSISKNKNILKSLSNIDEYEKNYYILRDKYLSLKKLIYFKTKYKNIRSDIISNEKKLIIVKNINITDHDLMILKEKIDTLKRMYDIKNEYSIIIKRISKGNIYLEKFCYLDDFNEIVFIIENKIRKLNLICNYNSILEKGTNEITSVNNIYNNGKNKIDNYLSEYKKLLLKIEICPYCFNKIDNESIKKIIDNYENDI